MRHQAQGLQQLFSGPAMRTVSVIAGPSAQNSREFVLALTAELAGEDRRVWLVETVAGTISGKLGCRPLLPWRANQPLAQQVIRAGACGLIHAPGVVAGDAALARAAAAGRACDYLVFDGGRFSGGEAPLEPATAQTLVVLLGEGDAEAGYALAKALQASHSPARVLLAGDEADGVAQAARHFLKLAVESRQTAGALCQFGNTRPETSCNTLSFTSNLTWVVSRITA